MCYSYNRLFSFKNMSIVIKKLNSGKYTPSQSGNLSAGNEGNSHPEQLSFFSFSLVLCFLYILVLQPWQKSPEIFNFIFFYKSTVFLLFNKSRTIINYHFKLEYVSDITNSRVRIEN